MAMRFGGRIGNFVRDTSLSSLLNSLRARSGYQFQVPNALKTAFSYMVEVAGFAYGGWLIYSLNLFDLRQKHENWKAEKRVQELLPKLDREKYPSLDSYMEMLEREVNALESRILERDTDMFKAQAAEREVEVLKAKVHAWACDEAKRRSTRSGTASIA